MATKTKVTKNSSASPKQRVVLSPVIDMLEQALKTYWDKFFIFFRLLLHIVIAFLPTFLLMLIVFVLRNVTGLENPSVYATLAILAILAVFFAIYYCVRVYLSLFLMVKDNFKKNVPDIFQSSRPFFWPYIGVALLNLALIGLLMIFLVVPGLIAAVFLSLSVFVLMFEGQRGFSALRRSFDLVRGYFWPVLGRIIFLAFVYWVFYLIISLPLAFSQKGSIFFNAWGGLISVIDIIIGPIYLLYMYQIYRELVKIKGKSTAK